MSTLNITEAAAVLKVHEKTVLDLIHAGAFPAAKVGRAWVMMEKDVLKYVENQIINQTAQRLGARSKARSPKTVRQV